MSTAPPDFAWFAAECRGAARAFVEGAAGGWGKRDLAHWLGGPYSVLAVYREESTGGAPPSSQRTGLDESRIRELMRRTRRSVVSALIDLAGGDWDAVTNAIQQGVVEPSRAGGELVWLPVDRPRTRLEARVLSLFLVDYLFDPDAYEAGFGWCAACDDLWFDGACPRCGADDARPSYVRQLAPSLRSQSR